MWWLPVEGLGAAPDWVVIKSLLPWLMLVAGIMIPAMWGILWGCERLDPGRFAILLQIEAVIGIATAAIFTSEPFGSMEILGTVLIVGAGTLEVMGTRRAPKKAVDAHP